MNHCFQSSTGSFFPSSSPFLFALSSSLSLPLYLFFLHFAPLFLFLSSFSFLLFSFVLSLSGSLTSPGTRMRGDVFKIVNTFQGVILSVFSSSSCPQVNKAWGFFVSRSGFRHVDFLFLWRRRAQCYSGFMYGCMRDREKESYKSAVHMYVCSHMCTSESLIGGPTLCLLLTPTVDTHTVVCMSFCN